VKHYLLARRLTAAAVVVAFAATGCGSAAGQQAGGAQTKTSPSGGAFPVVLTAANGTVRVPERPHAIVSLSPTATEMLYAIGAGSQVKAVDSDSDYPPSAPRTKLSGFSPNVEAIAAEQPDLVVISGYDASMLTKRLGTLHIPVLSLPAPAGINGTYSELAELGRATGHIQQARGVVAKMRRQIKAIVASVPHHAKPLTYYYELDQTYYSVTSSTFIGKLLGMLGMKSIADGAKGAAAAGGYPQLSAEYVLKANPDYIILADTICCHQDAATLKARPGWSAMTAVRDGHVIGLNDDIASRWGPRVVDLLRTVLAGIKGRQ
jgi:iron complex transport system substrate-binding protein